MLKAVLFGAGDGGRRILEKASVKYEIVAVTDNDPCKWGKEWMNGMTVLQPSECLEKKEFDSVIIASAPGFDTIYEQLIDSHIPEQKIISFYIKGSIESRIAFLEKFSVLYDEHFDKDVAVAEAGVFAGDFAKEINRYFFKRKLYLFDTFSGFDERDIKKEGGFSKARSGDYALTSEALVMSKMKYPQNCVIYKGYFPETADGLNVRYCFANLDLDLYEPTKRGLQYFAKYMVKDGIILVHDYFADNFKGPRVAVDEFLKESENSRLLKMPIGDGISIAICGF